MGSRIWPFDWYQTRWPWMTLNGVIAKILEKLIFPQVCVISPNSVAFGSHYIVTEDTPYFLRQKCSPKNVVLAISIIYGDTRRDHRSNSVNVRHSPLGPRCKKSHMGFRLVPKSMTLNDLERRNGHYFAVFCRICRAPPVVVKEKPFLSRRVSQCDRNA